jgi:hypothetical protein
MSRLLLDDLIIFGATIGASLERNHPEVASLARLNFG